MRGMVATAIVLAWAALLAPATVPLSASSEQGSSGASSDGTLPRDVNPESRNRLPAIRRDDLDERGKKAYDAAVTGASSVRSPQGAAAIRLHGSGVNVRWASTAGRQLTELAILTAAREHDQPYEWSLHEMEAVAVGLSPAVINIVRHRNRITGVDPKEATIIQAGREIFGRHRLSPDTYARGLSVLGKSDLVDLFDLMAGYSGTAARLTAFNQQMPPGWKQFLPLPFTPPNDIHPDSRSRLPLIRSQGPNPQATPSLYSRTLAPEGTGPGHIGRHGGDLRTLDARVGPRLTALAILVTAREHDAQYEWTVNEPADMQRLLDLGVDGIITDRPDVFNQVVAEMGREK